MIDSLQKLTDSQKETVLNTWLDGIKSGKIEVSDNPATIKNMMSDINKILPDKEHLILITKDPLHGGKDLSFKVVNDAQYKEIDREKTSTGTGPSGEIYQPGAIEKAMGSFFKSLFKSSKQ